MSSPTPGCKEPGCSECTTGRFWSKVKLRGPWTPWPEKAKPDCWIWVGASTQGGVSTKHKRNRYGNFRAGGVMWKAHRYAWVMMRGKPIEDGETIEHKCHYTLCVNPSHLEVKSRGANSADANRRRASGGGER